MKSTRRKRLARSAEPTPDQIRRYLQQLAEQHHEDWQLELMDAAPHWVYLIGIHLRLIELGNMESAVQEFL
jgi:hypothetical protein